MKKQKWLDNHCDGEAPHFGPDGVKRYPINADNGAILCLHCWAKENQFRFNKWNADGQRDAWPQHDWSSFPYYAEMDD